MKSRVTHLIKPGRMKTLNGMVDAYCMVIEGHLNKSSHVVSDATCKRCLAIRKRFENIGKK